MSGYIVLECHKRNLVTLGLGDQHNYRLERAAVVKFGGNENI